MDTRAISDRVRAYASEGGTIDAAELQRLAADYARCCDDINARLRRCIDYLHRGLRSEAIHLAEIQPPVLDEFATVDLAEREAWIGLCQSNGLAMPSPLLVDEAGELNEAYGEEQRLSPLLRANRVLALARAPLAERIRVLRELATLDPSGRWQDDVVELEKARLKQLPADLQQAVKAASLSGLEALQAEVRQAWSVPLPPAFLSRLNQAADELRSQVGERKLRELMARIDEAYAAMSFSDCERLLRQWDAVIDQHGVQLPDDLVSYIAPVASWVAEQQRQAAHRREMALLVGQLQQSIDAKAPFEQTEKLYERLVQGSEELPDSLKQAYREAETRELLRQRNRRVRTTLVIAAMVLLVAGGTGALVWRTVDQRRADQAVAAINKSIDAMQFDEAGKSVEELRRSHPRWASRASAVAAANRLETARRNEADRVRQFEEHLAAAGSDNVDSAAAAVDRAARTATSEQEKQRVEEARQRVMQAKAEQAAAREKRVTELLTELADVTQQLEQALSRTPAGDTTGLLKRAREIQSELATIPVIDAQLASAIDALRSRISRATDEQAKLDRRRVEWQQVRQAVGAGPSSLAKALKQFAAAAPDSPIATEATTASALEPKWLELMEWQSLREKWAANPFPELSAASARVTEIKAFRQKYPGGMDDALAGEYETLLSAMVSLSDPGGDVQKVLRSLMNSPLVRDLDVVHWQSGKPPYYVQRGERIEPPPAGSSVGGVTIRVVLTPDITDKTLKYLRVANDLKAVPSPQSRVGAKAIDRIGELRPDNAITLFADLTRTICTEEGIDPIFAAIMLEAVQSVQGKVPGAGDPGLDNVCMALAPLKVAELLWMNPEDERANRARPAVQRELLRLADHESRRKALEQMQRRVSDSLKYGVVTVGLLDGFEGPRRWYSASRPPDGAEVFALATTPENKTVLISVGIVQGGEVQLNAAAANVPIGSMLFAYRSR